MAEDDDDDDEEAAADEVAAVLKDEPSPVVNDIATLDRVVSEAVLPVRVLMSDLRGMIE